MRDASESDGDHVMQSTLRGLGNVRDLAEFAESAGISLSDCTVSDTAELGCFGRESVFADDVGDLLLGLSGHSPVTDGKKALRERQPQNPQLPLQTLSLIQTFMKSAS